METLASEFAIEKMLKMLKILRLQNLKLVIMFFGLLFSSVSFAQKSDQEKWPILVSKMVNEGKSLPTQYGDYRVLSDVHPSDKSAERVASYISAIVYSTNEETFVERVEAVWEDWKFDIENNFRVDQWLFRLSPEGEITSQSRSILILSKSGSVLGREYPQTSSQEMQLKWQKILEQWYLKL